VIVVEGVPDPETVNVGDVVFSVDDLESPTQLEFYGAKREDETFPDPLPIES
jgi:hypothetical protein